MSFFLPLGTVKALHVTSETTVLEVIPLKHGFRVEFIHYKVAQIRAGLPTILGVLNN